MHRRRKSLVHAAYRTAGPAMLGQNCVRLVTITLSNCGRRSTRRRRGPVPWTPVWTRLQNRPASTKRSAARRPSGAWCMRSTGAWPLILSSGRYTRARISARPRNICACSSSSTGAARAPTTSGAAIRGCAPAPGQDGERTAGLGQGRGGPGARAPGPVPRATAKAAEGRRAWSAARRPTPEARLTSRPLPRTVGPGCPAPGQDGERTAGLGQGRGGPGARAPGPVPRATAKAAEGRRAWSAASGPLQPRVSLR